MAAKAKKIVGEHVHIEDHGSDWRIERRFRPEIDTSKHLVDGAGQPLKDDGGDVVRPFKLDKDGNPFYHWVVYERVHTGLEIDPNTAKPKLNKNREPMLGVHPVIKGADGKGIPTHVEYVWVPRFDGLEDKARDYLAKRVK